MQILPETPTDEITIAGEKFKVFTPFAEGHVVTAGEAHSLNQTFSENIRNNFAKTVKTAKEAGSFDATAIQIALDAYQTEYEFGMRRVRGESTPRVSKSADPVLSRAIELAREAVRAAIRVAGGNPKDYSGADVTARARKAVEDNPRFREAAERQLEEEKNLAVVDLDSQPLEKKAPSEPKAAKAPKGKTAEAA